ncbi:hypothetical protein DV515_00011659 [Chloebia gouldiae]|uniref:Cadherin domain-containing protein n=1 Tax=Chloebia gouldiae TaxID=44316 RepID=A0A3L8S5Q2_CHLGU|nr:hypothetical protein DV515_00011659 [Chloebia gouldiae]
MQCYHHFYDHKILYPPARKPIQMKLRTKHRIFLGCLLGEKQCPSLHSRYFSLGKEKEEGGAKVLQLQCYYWFVLFFTGEICAFKIHGQEIPFEAVVLNKTSGEGQLRAKSSIDCELQKEYTFIIQAYDCGSGPGGTNWKKSHKAVVHIQVKDVNEFSPAFKESRYKASVTEEKIYDSILQVEATDEDCSPQYSQICNYEIVTTDVPFAIDRNGNIRNTEKLSYDKQHQYEIMVTAFDCGQKHATEDVLVRVNVKPVCKPGWQDWNKWIEYRPGSGSIPLFPSIQLETCDGLVSSIHTTIELQTNYIGKGCARETYSEKSLQKLCGASSGAIDLLPSPSTTTNWTLGLLTDSNDMIFKFDGKQGAKIPDGIVPKNLTDQFTITLWMKHGPSPGLRAEKETILCNSDKTEMNRHHYALYVHNCRLVFLLRKDFDQADTFRPAEFHWKLDQESTEQFTQLQLSSASGASRHHKPCTRSVWKHHMTVSARKL